MCTAIITGTGQGIGKAIASLLLKQGYFVYGISRKNYINNPNFKHLRFDLSDVQALKEIPLPKIKTNKIILINNAATIGEISPLGLKKDINIVKEYNVNIIAPTILCRKFINEYIDIEKLIINISSGAAHNAIASWSVYCASKAALEMLTKVIDKENHNLLKIYSVHPGIVNTNMQKTIRNTKVELFPEKKKFNLYYENNELENVDVVANKLFYIIKNTSRFNENILSIRNIHLN
tara:strand:+ start:461 stop:1165 length:705 start_codon:yes stop_codon:yes gene_type:complete